MDIKKLLREALLKENKPTNPSYGCLMVFLDYDKSEWNKLQDNIDKEDLFEPDTKGLEKDPHITILYGLHEDIKDEDIEKEIKEIEKPKIKLGGVSSFENEKFDVLKFDIESSDLHKLNKQFSDNFPYTTDYPNYEPHATIAYVKKGTAKKYLDKIKGIDVSPSKIVYSKVNGEDKNYKLD